MNDVAHIDTTDTLRPPPPPMKRRTQQLKQQARELEAIRRGLAKTYPVTVRCETEEQRAMLLEWLDEAGFEVEPSP